MANHFGNRYHIQIFGQSHAPSIGAVIEGLPAGFSPDWERVRQFMARRAPGNDAYSTKRRESDEPVFLLGIEDGVTTGEVIEAVIYNQNQHSSDYSSLRDTPRPSHADFTARMKYGEEVDLRGGGHFSGRLTAPMCIAGGICLQILAKRNIFIGAHAYSIGNVNDEPFDPTNISLAQLDALHSHTFPVTDESKGEKMREVIEDARLDGDSVGGIVEVAVIGLPTGLGEHMFSGVEGRISSVVFGIPAVKGIEFGLGFGSARIRGSQNNDPFVTDGKAIYTKTNNCGGILGGMTDGMPVVFRVAIKPTPSISKEQETVSLSRMENVKINIGGRHDPCIVPRAVPVLEAAAAIAAVDMLLDK